MAKLKMPEIDKKTKQRIEENKHRKEAKKRKMRGNRNTRSRNNNQTVLSHFGYTPAGNRLKQKTTGTIIQLYSQIIANWLRRGWQRSNVPDHHIPFNKFYYSSNKIYTTGTVKIPYILFKWQCDSLPIGWVSVIRNDLEKIQNDYNTANGTNYMITFNHLEQCNKSKIKAFSSNPTYQNQFDRLRRQYEKNLMELDNPDIAKAQKAQHLGEENYNLMTTYEWLMDLEEDDNSSLWETYELCEVVVSGDDGMALNELAEKACDNVISRFNYFKIKIKDLMMMVQSYYDDQSFIGHQRKRQVIHKQFSPENRESSYLTSGINLQEGSVSDLVGVPVGIDIFNQKPVYVDYTDNSLSPNTLVAGITGSGKTFLVQTLITAFLQFPQFYFPVICDVKNEYRRLAKLLGMQFVSLSPSDGVYIDTLVIPSPTGDNEIDLELKEDSLRDTEAIFEILLGEKWKELDVQSAFNFVRNSLYRKRGVVLDNPNTWKNSSGLTFHSFYDEIGIVMQEKATQAKESAGGSLQPFKEMKQILSNYFEKDGAKASYFQRPISLSEIDDSTGVVFGLDQNVSTMNNDERLTLSIRFMMHLLKTLTVKIKKQKRLLMTFFEETNQLVLMPHIADLLSRFASGGRSFGMRNFFITNAPRQIFDAKELKNDNSDVNLSAISALESNIGSVIVGSLKKKDMQTVYERMLQGKQNVTGFLKLLIQEAGNSGKSAMSHTFILLHRGKTALIQALANPALVEQHFFGSEIKTNSRYNQEITVDDLLEEKENKQGLQDYVQEMRKQSKEFNDKTTQRLDENSIKRNLFNEQSRDYGARDLSRRNYNQRYDDDYNSYRNERYNGNVSYRRPRKKLKHVSQDDINK